MSHSNQCPYCHSGRSILMGHVYAQAFSYKVGADFIFKLKQKCKEEGANVYDEKKFHRSYLSFGMVPLLVIENSFKRIYTEQKL